MKKITTSLMIVGVSIVLVGCGRPGTEVIDPVDQEMEKEVFYIETSSVSDLKQSSQLNKNGILLGADTVTVTAQIGGRVSQILPDIGSNIAQGSRVLAMSDSAGSVSFGVERARASLEQARINYEQTLLGIDQQIDETRRSIRQAENQSQTARIQAENTQLEGQSAAQLQLNQLEQQYATAQLDLETKLTSDQQQIQNFVSSAQRTLRDAQLLYQEVIDENDKILGVTNLNKTANDSFERYLSARNTSLKFAAEDELRRLINKESVLTSLTISESSLSSDLEYIQNTLEGLIPFLKTMEDVLLNTTEGNNFLPGQLAGLNSLIDGLQATVQGQTSGITQQINSIELFLSTYQGQQQSIRESIDSLQTQIAATRENLQTAQRTSTVSLDTASLGVERAQASLENLIDTRKVTERSLSNAIRQSEIALRELQTNAGKFTVEAPIAGTIGEILVDVGQEINPGTPLFTITSTSELEIEIGLTSNEVQLVQEGQTVTISDGDTEYNGVVNSITRTANQSLVYKAKITPLQQPSLLGGVVAVTIPLQDDTLLLPLKHVTIVTTDLGRITTYQNGSIEIVPVALGPIQGSAITIQEALDQNLQIITSPVRTYDSEKYTIERKK